MRSDRWVWVLCLAMGAAIAAGIACGPDRSSKGTGLPPLPGERTGVFSTERPSILAAVADHLDLRSTPVQPLEFPHDVHVANGIGCNAICHSGVMVGRTAGLPSLKVCMTCHATIATDKPRVQEIARLASQGQDLSWQRVYGFVPQAHVRFIHAPHIQANVACEKCHGPISQQTVARRNVNLTMGFCVNCHRANKAPDDCLTCHQ